MTIEPAAVYRIVVTRADGSYLATMVDDGSGAVQGTGLGDCPEDAAATCASIVAHDRRFGAPRE